MNARKCIVNNCETSFTVLHPLSLPPSQLTAAVVLTASVPATVEATAAPVSARDARELTARVDPTASAPRNAALDVPSAPNAVSTFSVNFPF